MKLSEVVRSGDWKSEKHVPVIEAPENVPADQPVEIGVTIGADNPPQYRRAPHSLDQAAFSTNGRLYL